MNTYIAIPCKETIIDAAREEASGRIAHMRQRYEADNERRIRSLTVGYIVEKHVYHHLRELFPQVVTPPENEGDYTKGSPYDFKLALPRKIQRVEVYGQLMNDYGTPYYRIVVDKKCDADLFIFARYNERENHVAWDGWCLRAEYEHLPRNKDRSVGGSYLERFSALVETRDPRRFIDTIDRHLEEYLEDTSLPVYFDGPDNSPPPVTYSFADRKKFYREGDGWKDCVPKNFETSEGEIWKNRWENREQA